MMSDFSSWFQQITGRAPHPWQAALAAGADPGDRLLRVPTGFGKTLGVLGAWVFHRVIRADLRWPCRLVWVLPMRTLVEQTELEARALLEKAGLLWDGEGAHAGRVGVHVLMGGAEAGGFHLHPSDPAVLIGTQDMLLSRALNRGYGAARARWPMEFGLLSQDALWVLDEVQLMGVGFATAMQLAAFRHAAPSLRPCHSWAMSATLQQRWIEQSPDTGALAQALATTALGDGDRQLPLWAGSEKPITRLDLGAPAAQAAKILEEHGALSTADPLTLVVCNTVERATALAEELGRRAPAGVSVNLIHSRFRGHERSSWKEGLLRRDAGAGSRVLVATQVVEAGVDLSADLLFTELCPWPSLVQRLGRLARRGGRGAAFVLGLTLPKQAPPYEEDDLAAAAGALERLSDASPRALDEFEKENDELLPSLYRFEPPHLLLREEIEELFDTTADLSGGDLDVSRYIREGEERDLSVAWVALERDARGRALAPASELRPPREALCAVPFLTARDWLCGRKSGGVEPRRPRAGVSAFLWDYLDGAWRPLTAREELRPGVVVLVDAAVGGYDPRRGFDPGSRAPAPPLPLVVADRQERADAAEEQDDLSQAAWQTIGFHGGAVADELAALLGGLGPLGQAGAELGALLRLAARWHDLGKAHPAFQGAISGEDRPERSDLAKAPPRAWAKGRCLYRMSVGDPPRVEARRGLRHELASTLALFDVLLRWAPPEHPARLGPWAAALGGEAPRGAAGEQPGPLEREILALSAEDFDLVAFLVLAHHGKLRARMHAAPADQDAPPREGALPIRGIYEGDRLPAVALRAVDGASALLPESRLSLEPAALGVSPLTGRSWTERVDALRARLGPFALAWLEALLRAADVRASRDLALSDPALVEVSP